MTETVTTGKKDFQEFESNPYDHHDKRPEDVVRLFYLHDVPIIPVVSKRGVLIGILRKETVIAELSDIERVEKLKIDEFITNISSRMNFEDLLQYGKIREFTVINIFGEIQGKWSRIQLFNACETGNKIEVESEVKQQKEDEVMESMIFSILEHIPRALYAVNEKGKTIFYNGHFEELYEERFKSEVEVEFVENLVNEPGSNELFSDVNDGDIYFFNSELDAYYEKVPILSGSRKNGYLIFFDKGKNGTEGLRIPGLDLQNMPLPDILQAVERQLIVDTLHGEPDLGRSAGKLKITRQQLAAKIKKMDIKA